MLRQVGLGLTDEQWGQATLPISKGGVGMREGVGVADAAYVASRVGTREVCRALDGEYVLEGENGDGMRLALPPVPTEGAAEARR